MDFFKVIGNDKLSVTEEGVKYYKSIVEYKRIYTDDFIRNYNILSERKDLIDFSKSYGFITSGDFITLQDGSFAIAVFGKKLPDFAYMNSRLIFNISDFNISLYFKHYIDDNFLPFDFKFCDFKLVKMPNNPDSPDDKIAKLLKIRNYISVMLFNIDVDPSEYTKDDIQLFLAFPQKIY